MTRVAELLGVGTPETIRSAPARFCSRPPACCRGGGRPPTGADCAQLDATYANITVEPDAIYVRNYLSSAFEKLRARNRIDAVRIARERGRL